MYTMVCTHFFIRGAAISLIERASRMGMGKPRKMLYRLISSVFFRNRGK